MSLKIKICGITSAADARCAVDAGADALGFMFYEPSVRWVTPGQAAEILREVPSSVARVGVFVNPTEDEVRRVLAETGIDTLQFHGEETPEFCRHFGLKVMKAFRMRDEGSLKALPAYAEEAWLLDSFVPGQIGGTGAKFNWNLAIAAKRWGRAVWLAGGLTPENAAEAVRLVRPHGLDVSSGVECAPGKKDAKKVRDFVASARGADVMGDDAAKT